MYGNEKNSTIKASGTHNHHFTFGTLAPHFGQALADVETSVPQSLHTMSAMSTPLIVDRMLTQ